MNVRKLLWCAQLLFFCTIHALDVTIYGFLMMSDGLGSIPFMLARSLKSTCSLNFINTRPHFSKDFSGAAQDIRALLEVPGIQIGAISIMTDALARWNNVARDLMQKSKIRMCYSMFETDKIPSAWVRIINEHFDGVIVPDLFLKKVYNQSGVVRPIFVLPLPMDLSSLLASPLPNVAHTPFTFGVSSSFTQRKNHQLLLESFADEFGSDPCVWLKIHGRYRGNAAYQALVDTVKRLKLTNVQIIDRVFSRQEYEDFLTSLDCYVLLSKGEGYSLTPREAMACGIPCILANNTAQKTLCATGLVYSVPSEIQEPADYEDKELCVGNFYNCHKAEVRKALRHVYDNYELYRKKAERGRTWVRRYDYKLLSQSYINIVRPRNVILGQRNEVTDYALITQDINLFRKYTMLSHGL